MKSITKHRTDADLDKKLLKKKSFSALFGKWTKTEKKEFDHKTGDFEIVHESDWKNHPGKR